MLDARCSMLRVGTVRVDEFIVLSKIDRICGIQMPEAAEVAIIMNNMSTMLKEKTLRQVTIEANFQKRTKDMGSLNLPQLVKEVSCKGKFGYVILEDGSAIGFGFGMTGNIRIAPDEAYLKSRGETYEKYMKHNKAKFEYSNSDSIDIECFYYNCIRNFGYIHYFDPTGFAKKLSGLGPSILSEEILDPSILLSRWKKNTLKNICVVLLDQSLISGIGNYIKAEVMYACKVNPMSNIKDIDDNTLYNLYSEARRVAAEAYSDGGASLYTYTGLHGDKSNFKMKLCVYNRRKDPLGNEVYVLKTPDKRTTHWVPAVQASVKMRIKIKARLKPKILPDLVPKL